MLAEAGIQFSCCGLGSRLRGKDAGRFAMKLETNPGNFLLVASPW
jgi:hypothetical protein